MMGDKFWSELRATIAGLNKKPMVKTASAKDPNRVAVAEAKASGFFVKAKAMGWGLYQVEELDGGLGSIWHVEKDAATGEQFLVKQVDPVGDIVRRVKTASAKSPDADPYRAGIEPFHFSSVVWPGSKKITNCKHCGAFIDTAFGSESPAAHAGASGTKDDPRSPGDYDDVCDACNYGEGLRGGPMGAPPEKTAAAEPGGEEPLSVGDEDLAPAPEQPAAAPVPMSDMVRSYLGTALWSSTDNSTESGGEPLDKNYDIEDFAPEAVAKATADCAAFEEKAGPLLEGIERQGQDVPDVIGFHFWLTRNHHGAGFWDGDYPKEIGEALTKLSHEFGETDAYVGDDGKLHLL